MGGLRSIGRSDSASRPEGDHRSDTTKLGIDYTNHSYTVIPGAFRAPGHVRLLSMRVRGRPRCISTIGVSIEEQIFYNWLE